MYVFYQEDDYISYYHIPDIEICKWIIFFLGYFGTRDYKAQEQNSDKKQLTIIKKTVVKISFEFCFVNINNKHVVNMSAMAT